MGVVYRAFDTKCRVAGTDETVPHSYPADTSVIACEYSSVPRGYFASSIGLTETPPCSCQPLLKWSATWRTNPSVLLSQRTIYLTPHPPDTACNAPAAPDRNLPQTRTASRSALPAPSRPPPEISESASDKSRALTRKSTGPDPKYPREAGWHPAGRLVTTSVRLRLEWLAASYGRVDS
jgi:hypothetical protein